VRASVRKLDEIASRFGTGGAGHSRRELDQVRAGINEAFALSSQRLESALHEEAPEIAESLASQARAREAEPPARPALAPGMAVRIPKWKNVGSVVELQSGGKVKVAMGTLQMSLPAQDVEPMAPSEIAQLPKSHPLAPKKAAAGFAPSAPDSRLDLRGSRYDEAMSELAAYLDLAYRSGALAEVTIVHGLGTGALREGTRKLLSSLPYVKSFQDGGAGRGGTGATVVEFDRD
jgi:DNA mismatch repair protein MutS2